MYVYAENEGPNLSGSNLNRNTDRHTDRHTDTQTDMPEIITYYLSAYADGNYKVCANGNQWSFFLNIEFSDRNYFSFVT